MGLQGHFCFPIQSIKKRGIVGNYFKALMIALWEVTIIGKLQRRYQAPEWFGALIVKHESRYEAPLEKFHIKARTFGSLLRWFTFKCLVSACNPRTCLPFPRHVNAEVLRRGTAHHKVTWKCRIHAEYFSWEREREGDSRQHSPCIVFIIEGVLNCCAHGSFNVDISFKIFPAQRVWKSKRLAATLARSLAALFSRSCIVCSI